MKLAISMYSFRRYAGEFTHAEAIAFCREEGVGIELLDGYLTGAAGEVAELKRMMRGEGVGLASYDASNDFALRDATLRRQELDKVRRAVDVARELEAKVVRVFMGDEKAGGGFTVEEATGWICEGLSEAGRYARSVDPEMVLAVENHGKLVGRSAQVRGIIERVGLPNVRVTLDLGNFMCVDEDPVEGFNALLPYMAHVHLKDFKRLPDYAKGCSVSKSGRKIKGAILGEGAVDLRYMLGALHRRGYAGFMSLEFEGWEDFTYGLKRGIENVRAMMPGKL